MNSLSTPVKISLVIAGIALCILVVFSLVPQVPAGEESANISRDNHDILKIPGLGSVVPPRNSGDTLTVFSSPEKVRRFLQDHTIPPVAYYRNSRWSFSGSTGTISVTDCDDTRIWRYTVDSTGFIPDEYIVTVGAVKEEATGTALFNVLEGVRKERIPAHNRTIHVPARDEKYYIDIDPVGDRFVGEQFTITGSTNLPADEELLVQVYTSSFKPTQKSQSGEFSGATARTGDAGSAAPWAYSETNTQVAGVDEADIFKTDGRNLYTISGSRIFIHHAYPIRDARDLSLMTMKGTPVSLYVNGDRLVVFVTETQDNAGGDICRNYGTGGFIQKTRIFIYSISNPGNPELLRQIEADGDYVNSRMIGQYLYFITAKPVSLYSEDLAFPSVREKHVLPVIPEVYTFGQNNTKFTYTLVGALDTRSDTAVRAVTFLTGADSTVYVSVGHLFLGVASPSEDGMRDQTRLYTFLLENETIRYHASGNVPGSLLNQYSLDEYQGNLRVATNVMEKGTNTSVPILRSTNVYVLDGDLNIIGSTTHIAPDEVMHSTRFMGDRLYLVTFKELDPFFVIDLSNPAKPEILGELKLPGFSEYLHPYDNTHIIGVGKETVQNRWGGASAGGVKVSLFDVTRVTAPTLIDSIEIGGPYSTSEVFGDPRAFLFNRQKGLIVLPVYVAGSYEDERSRNPRNFTLTNNENLNGAFVFGVDPVKGFTNRGVVVHSYNSYSAPHVKRALYINDTLFTMSRDEIIMSDLNNASHRIATARLR